MTAFRKMMRFLGSLPVLYQPAQVLLAPGMAWKCHNALGAVESSRNCLPQVVSTGDHFPLSLSFKATFQILTFWLRHSGEDPSSPGTTTPTVASQKLDPHLLHGFGWTTPHFLAFLRYECMIAV